MGGGGVVCCLGESGGLGNLGEGCALAALGHRLVDVLLGNVGVALDLFYAVGTLDV